MGLFDTFIVKEARCELCGHIYNADFQTKVFDPMLRTFKQQQDVKKLFTEIGFRFKNGNAEFEMHDVCPKCGEYFETFGVVKSYRFVGQIPKGRKSKIARNPKRATSLLMD